MGDEFDFEFHDVEFEELVKNSVPSYKAKELIKMSRAVDKFGNKMDGEGYRVMVGLIDGSDDLFKFYSNMNPMNQITLEMLARLVKKTCDEIQQIKNLDESPMKEIVQMLKEEIENRG